LNNSKAVVVLSGGLDSSTLLHYVVKTLEKDVTALSFDYGQRHVRELQCASDQISEIVSRSQKGIHHRILNLDFMKRLETSALTNSNVPVPTIKDVLGHPSPTTYVPFRNAIFVMIAASVAEDVGASELYLGIQLQDRYGYWDTTEEFQEAIQAVFDLSRKSRIQVCAPFVDKSKTEILLLGMELGVNYSKTWTCYSGRERACGTCPTCAERLFAFQQIGVSDPVPYETSGES
jgi:7-cyano-7-deazaguanine synthase